MAALDAEPPVTEAGTVFVAESERAPPGQIVQAGRHRLATDEPEPIGANSGPTPYDQRDGLVRIADRCPVHRTLQGSVAVVTTRALSPRPESGIRPTSPVAVGERPQDAGIR